MILKFRINIRELLTLYDEIVVLKQDKETGVVILDNKIYVEIYLSILGYHFMKLDKNRTSSYESKIHRSLRKIKPKLSTEEYKKLYPAGSNAGRFYGTAKIYKIDRNDKVDKLPLRHIYPTLTQHHVNLLNTLPNYFHH